MDCCSSIVSNVSCTSIGISSRFLSGPMDFIYHSILQYFLKCLVRGFYRCNLDTGAVADAAMRVFLCVFL